MNKNQSLDKNEQLKPMLFAGNSISCYGGWDNFQGFYDSIDECKAALQRIYPVPWNMWGHIVMNWQIVLYAQGEDFEWKFSEIETENDDED